MAYHKKKVVIIQKNMAHYRVPFFEFLRKRLSQSDIDLVLIYGQQDSKSTLKGDSKDIPWAIKIENKIFSLGSKSIYWQPCLKYLRDADLIIVEQASKLLLNYMLMLQQITGRKKIAFWGHGRNMQEHAASRIGESIKRFMSRKVRWWFAYNDLSASFVRGAGYAPERITSVQNAIDTKHLIDLKSKASWQDIEQVIAELGFTGKNVCIFTGGMYSEKRLDFLIEACIHCRKRIPEFEMIFIGSGPEYDKVEKFAAQHDWVQTVGPKFDADKVLLFSISKLLLMPGLVGLAVLDSFALEVPMVTTNVQYHSPEIDYLKNGINGIILAENVPASEYADTVVDLLTNNEKRMRLVIGCNKSKTKFTIETMVERFADGIEKALEANVNGYK